MPAKGSFLPAHRQIPIAVGLGAILLLIGWVRFGRAMVADGEGSGDSPDVAAAAQAAPVSLDGLRLILDRIQQVDSEVDARIQARPALARDPFAPLSEPIREVAFEPEGEAPDSARDRWAAAAALTSTLIGGGDALARIDGRLVRVGDAIGGFSVRAIAEGEVTLEDELGLVTLRRAREVPPR